MNTLLTAAIWSLAATAALADAPTGAVQSPANPAVQPSFDILAAQIYRDQGTLIFQMTTNGIAGADTPPATGALAGAAVWSYVWPTTLDPATVGFEGGSGILALVATSHPDFDDTPLYDETTDGDAANDGAVWHAHWVVLTPNNACGAGMLSVRDIPKGTTPALPATWPGLPLFIDSPAATPIFDGAKIRLTLPLAADGLPDTHYDGVTVALRVNANMHAPLLCVTDVFDIASSDLSLPGQLN